MKFSHCLLLLTLLITQPQAFADVTPQGSQIVGTWILEKSNNPLPSGEVVPYCTGLHGMIIYSEDGFVSVSINCAPTGVGKEPADISDRRFFYAGTYDYDGQNVVHNLHNASQTNLIGTSFKREVKLEDDLLILSGHNQGQEFSAHWRRVAKKAKKP
jgi:hypothetical protein